MSTQTIRMDEELETYLWAVSGREPPVLAALREETQANPRRGMQVSPMQGQFMGVLVKAVGARKILEVGVFTGYSSLSMVLALPDDGRLIALDISEDYTALARKYWDKAGVAHKVDLRIAPATESMDAMIAGGESGSFDMVFIDADKPAYPEYWERGLTLLRPGGLIIADNTLFQGTVGPGFDDGRLAEVFGNRPPEVREELIGNTHAARAFNAKVHQDDRVDLSLIPVGDGMTLGVKR